MQVISDFGTSASDLCRELASVAKPSFFDDVVMAEGSSTTVECKKNGTTVLEILYQGIIQIRFPSNNLYAFYRAGTSFDYIHTIVVTDKAVYIANRYGNGASVIITKDLAGNLSFITYYGSSSLSPIPSSSGTYPIWVFNEDGTFYNLQYYLYFESNSRRAYCIPIYRGNGEFIDGVYLSLIRPYPEISGNIAFTMGSKGYVGFMGSAIITESD